MKCKKVGLGLKVKKTKSMVFNIDFSPLTTANGEEIGQALPESRDQDFKYLGSWS